MNLDKNEILFIKITSIAGIFSCVLLFVYGIYSMLIYPSFKPIYYLSYIGVGFCLLAFFIFTLNKNNNSILSIMIILSSFVFLIYSFNLFYFFDEWKISEFEILNKLRSRNIKSYNNEFLLPHRFTIKNKNRSNYIHPLGGISKSTIICSHEGDQRTIYQSDEHGFNNPKDLYKKDGVDILISGNSFAEGYGVSQNESIQGYLIKRGFKTISVGKAGGNGTLLEYASLVEYGKPLRPKIVLWVNTESYDLEQMKIEFENKLLVNYLSNPGYSQELINKQAVIDSILISFHQELEEQRIIINEKAGIKKLNIIKLLKLHYIRTKIGLIPRESKKVMLNNNDINNFRDILKSAENIVSDWGGKLYFVQLPMWARYYGGNKEEKNDLYNIIINEVNKLEIPIIDIHKIGFSNLYDPLSYYNRRRANGHYNSKGYKLVSDLIIDRLMKDGLIH